MSTSSRDKGEQRGERGFAKLGLFSKLGSTQFLSDLDKFPPYRLRYSRGGEKKVDKAPVFE